MATKVKRVGFLGLGDMGLPMAKNIVTKGYDLIVCGHVRRTPIEEVKALGAKEVKTPKELAQLSDVIITMLPDDIVTGDILFGSNGIFEGAREGTGIILMSTLSPAFCRKVGEAAKAKRIEVLEAPVLGARMRATTGELSIAVGGEKKLLEKYLPLLETMGKKITYFGDLGWAQTAKLASNMLNMVQTFAAYEVIAWGVKNGVSEEQLVEYLKSGSANNWALQNWDYIKSMWVVPPPTSFYMGGKDLSYALKIGQEIGQPCPFTALVCEIQKAGPPDLSKLKLKNK